MASQAQATQAVTDANAQVRLPEYIQRGYYLAPTALSIHRRHETFVAHVTQRANVGNIHINRDQIAAMVSLQFFGGQAESDSGPKAGSPH